MLSRRLSTFAAVICCAASLITPATRSVAQTTPDLAVQVSVGGEHSCVLTTSGRVRCWGSDRNSNKATVPADLGVATAIAVGDAGTCAIVSGALKCWGQWSGGDIAAPDSLDSVEAVVVSGETWCILTTAGQPKCWGNNYVGQAGVPASPQTSRLLSVDAGRSCALTTDSRVYCWSNNNWFNINGSEIPGARKFTGNTNYLCFLGSNADPNAFHCGGWDPLSYLVPLQQVRQALDYDAEGANICVIDLHNTVHCAGPDPAVNAAPGDLSGAISVAVGARHACAVTEDGEVRCWGANDYGQATPPADLQRPGLPESLRPAMRTTTGVNVAWAAPSGGGSIDSYLLEYSTDVGAHWNERQVPATQSPNFTIRDLKPAMSLSIRVSAVNAIGSGATTPTIETSTTGTNSFNLMFTDARGLPLSGGEVRWRLADNTAWSSHTFGLTSTGTVDVLAAPAGAANVTFTNAMTSEGALVNGSIPVTLGTTLPSFSIPESGVSRFAVHVSLPNGVPVSDARVAVIEPQTSANLLGLAFAVPLALASSKTDEFGNASVTSITSLGHVTSARITFDDGEITQSKIVNLDSPQTSVELDLMPWVQSSTAAVAAAAGKATSISVSAAEPALPSLRRGVAGHPVSGIQVSLTALPGLRLAKCRGVASGTTGPNGKATLTLCPLNSGTARLKVKGATGSRLIDIRVPGSPGSPRDVKGRSTSSGGAIVTWQAPSYIGAKKLTGYEVTLKYGATVKTLQLSAKTQSASFAGLPNAIRCSFSVRAKLGANASNPVVGSVSVA